MSRQIALRPLHGLRRRSCRLDNEADRPNRKTRRQRGKSDPIDAEAAARAVLAGTATALPKRRDGIVEAIGVLRGVRAGAVKARTAAINQLKAVVVTAPLTTNEQWIAFEPGELRVFVDGQAPG